jgi:hypothetical protein
LRQASFFGRASRSSIGARAVPPPYQTAMGKTSSRETGAAVDCGEVSSGCVLPNHATSAIEAHTAARLPRTALGHS